MMKDTMSPKKRLLTECLLIFGLVPPVLAALKPHGLMYVMLWIAAALSWRWLARHDYKFREDWNRIKFGKNELRAILIRFVPIAIALGIFTYIAIPDRLFSLPLERPRVWVMVMILYPLLSVIPQEILFRSFFFRRYAPLFSGRAIMLASALAFGWVHILLLNWVAVVFSALGGLLFADTYARTRSLAAACFEHALYGCTIFTLGLGYYFYHGQAVH